MENKHQDVHLRAMLNSPARATPAVPTPDWGSPPPVPQQPPIQPLQPSSMLATLNPNSSIQLTLPGSAVGEPQTNITLQNCVATSDVNATLDMEMVNARTRNSEYNPSRFHGVVMRLREPRSTALIFRTGKIVCAGARSERDSLLASKKFAKIIQKLGYNVRFTNFKIQNIVATCDLRFPIKLENLNVVHGQFSTYEPELFPGLVYRMIKPRLVLLIFVNGKIVFTGAKSRQDIKEGLENIYPILRSFRKN